MLQVSVHDNVFNSSLEPQIWGPALWYLLHMASTFAKIDEGLFSEDRRNWEAIFRGLPTMIPCLACKTHARKFIETHPMGLDSRDKLFVFFVVMHNAVNLRHGKTPVTPAVAAKLYGLFDSHILVRANVNGQQMMLDGVDPKIWAPIFWFTLFNMGMNLPVLVGSTEMHTISNYLAALPVLFPHEPTRSQLKNWLARNPPIFHSSGRLYVLPYLVEMHNALHPTKSMTYKEAELRYGFETFRASIEIRITQD